MALESRFALDAEGKLSPLEPSGQKLLAPRVGNYAVMHTSPDWLLMLRHPSAGDVTSERPRIAMSGDCGVFPLSDLIAFLGQMRWSGLVRIHTPNGQRTLALKDGEVRWANSDSMSDRIGEVMVRMGYLNRRQLDHALATTPPSRIGRYLVEKGEIQAHDLFKCLNEQVSEIFHSMMLAKEGAFLLIDQDVDEKNQHNLSLSMQNLLMDSIRKIDEMAHFRKRIAHGRLFVTRKRPSDGKLEAEEDQVLALCSGTATVLEIGQVAKLSEFDVTRIVYRLLEGGYASVSQSPASAAPPPVAAPPPEAAIMEPLFIAPVTPADAPWERRTDPLRQVVNVFNLIFKEIHDELAKHGRSADFVKSANAAIEGDGVSSSPALRGLRFDPSGALPEAALLKHFEAAKAQLGSEPVASLRQALSDVMFFLLFQVGELLEQRADEDLARRVKDLLATLEG